MTLVATMRQEVAGIRCTSLSVAVVLKVHSARVQMLPSLRHGRSDMFDNRFRVGKDSAGYYVKDEWTNLVIYTGTEAECSAFFEGLRTGIRLS
ncbi:hypothetical protein K22PH164C1_LOCUS23 [Klebsiella phage vB_Kpn_K22PH164C1]|uniref:Uncharacterized protein n=1 Tax=Klebsiella phage vB_Kpn_K22PH164C1 TaxID=3071617 RepID=A0AAV1MJ64_9CAUD|nr:hypothetical protein K22PH164C1_LOCUS23 [Klebsiella phage vB_Kpn_K22PH164C1]